jgi:hypothetical protein
MQQRLHRPCSHGHKRAVSARLLKGGLLSVLVAFGAAAQASISFQFDYSGNTPGVGFLDPVLGAARQQALTDAGNLYASMFGSYFSNSGIVTMAVTSTDDANSDTLASAGSELLGNGTPGFTVVDVVRTKLLTGVDENGATADGSVDVNWGHAWALDPNTPASNAEFDFFAAISHELTHALGFSSLVNQDGTDIFGNSNPGEYGAFDAFLVDLFGSSLIDANGNLDSNAWIAASTGGSSLFFNGANAVAANGGNLVGLYSPTTWSEGSSGSHLDTDNPLFSTSMMKHNRDFGPETRVFSAVEVGMLMDLGYLAASQSVPEPQSYALFLAGLGVMGAVMRRRRA